MISLANQELLQNAIEAVRQHRAETGDAAAAHTRAIELASSKGAMKPTAAKSKTSVKKPAAKPKPAAGPTITPYLTAGDLAEVGDRTAAAENADSLARNAYQTAAANALTASGDVERGRVRNVSAANNDAAARGIYDSGIRAGNVGLSESAAARGQTQIQGGLALASAQTTAARNAAKQQLSDFMQTVVARSAENGAALPVNPYDNGAGNVKGAATLKRTKKATR